MSISKSSFRDPDGFIFENNGKILRQINSSYASHYEHLISSGLYKKLTEARLLLPHKELDSHSSPAKETAWKTIEPEQIRQISYPYEWCFDMLKDAALLTLRIQEEALSCGMSLKDASAYNVQFTGTNPRFIDTLSFEKTDKNNLKPWVAYNQFCRHFLAPLYLMKHLDLRLDSLLNSYIEGVPIDLASKLLPLKTYLKPGALFHIHLHSRMIKKYAKKQQSSSKQVKTIMSSLRGIVDSLKSSVKHLKLPDSETEWGNYYEGTNYSKKSFDEKKNIVSSFLDVIDVRGHTVLDLGANRGVFSELAAQKKSYVVSADIDPVAVEKNYRFQRKKGCLNIHPLKLDIMNPSPAIGWNNRERESFLSRCRPKATMALAFIHHLAISNNLPLPNIASFFAHLSPFLIIEFVDKSDSQVQKLLSSREDIFQNYTREEFEGVFGKYFHIVDKKNIGGSMRTLYLLKSKDDI